MIHFHRGDKKYSLLCRKRKTVIPKFFEKVVEWCHYAPSQPGETGKELYKVQYFVR